MQVRMMQQILAPGVKDGEESDSGAQVLGIGGDGEQGLRSGAEQNAVHDPFVLERDGGNLFRHGEDRMKVRTVEKLGFAVFDPLSPGQRLAFGTMAVRARVIAGMFAAALAALFQMSAQCRGPAQCDRVHDAAVLEWDGMRVQIRLAMTAEHVRHFQPRRIHARAAGLAR